jgi:hypothetical protein
MIHIANAQLETVYVLERSFYRRQTALHNLSVRRANRRWDRKAKDLRERKVSLS